jgi:hypothetical protein
MNFPDEPFFRFLHWLIDTPSLGGLIVLTITSAVFIIVAFTLYWIVLGAQVDETEIYAYPTPTLLGHKDTE